MKKHIDPGWVSWAKDQITKIAQYGYLCFPDGGVILKVNKSKKTITLVCCVPDWIDSDLEELNLRVFEKIGYRYVRPEQVPTSPESMIDEIFENYPKYILNLDLMIHGIGVIFKLKREDEDQNQVIIDLITRMDKKIPINPVTIRGMGNLIIGRNWIETEAEPDSWLKLVGILVWNKENETPIKFISQESDFIEVANHLKTAPVVKLWSVSEGGIESKVALFTRQNDDLKVEFYKLEDNYEKTFVGVVVVNFNKFFEGLFHLFCKELV